MSDERRNTPLEPESIEPQMCTIDLRLEILHGLPFFAGLSHEDVAAINPLFREFGFEAGAPIYFAGDTAERLYVVAAGKVKLLRHALSGQERVLDLLLPGDFFGTLPVMGETTYPDTAQAPHHLLRAERLRAGFPDDPAALSSSEHCAARDRLGPAARRP